MYGENALSKNKEINMRLYGGKNMAKIIVICGKICSGKSTYSEKLKKEINAVVLSCDELMLTLFDKQLGDKHDDIVKKCSTYLHDLAQKIIHANTNVILDWGSWTKEGRKNTIEFFKSKNIEVEMHYIKVDDKTWIAQIEKRNLLVEEGKSKAYYVDENLKEKSGEIFEELSIDEEYFLIDNTSK